jgi:large conductance mechanosensitive channel
MVTFENQKRNPSMIREFKQFALRGNVMDLAVAVIIGGAFGAIVTSIVSDLIMPLVGVAFQADFSNLYFPLSRNVSEALAANPDLTLAEAKTLGPVFAWGNFLTVGFNFIILAFIIFLLVKGMNAMKKKNDASPVPVEPSADVKLLTEIRDLLKNKN